MKKLIFIAFVFGFLAWAYNISHVNYQIHRFTLADMTATRAMVHWKWEHKCLGTPGQYRPFIDFVTHKLSPKCFIRNGDRVYETRYSNGVVWTMKFFVIVSLFVLLAFYYRKLGFDENRILIGLFIFFLVFIAGVQNETFRLNTYLEICYYLSASLLLLYKKSWIPILAFMPIAALNRETCFFVPWIMVSLFYFQKKPIIEYLKPASILLIWAVLFIGVRQYYPVQTIHNFGPNGAYMSFDWAHSFLKDNLTNINSLALWLVFPLSAVYLYFTKRKFANSYLLQGMALPVLALTLLGFYGGTINEICTWEVSICTFLIPMFLTEKVKS